MPESCPRDEFAEYLSNLNAQYDELESLTNKVSQYPDIWYRVTVGGLTNLANDLKTKAINIALDGIEAHNMTRVAAAETLDVHPNTISRWLLARETQQAE